MAYREGHEISRNKASIKMSSNFNTGSPKNRETFRGANTRRKPNARFFTILATAAGLITVALVLILQGKPTVAVEQGSVDYNVSFDMLILRDEVVYTAKNYGKTDFIATEGAHVEPGDPIVKVYELGYNEETISELLDLQKTILNYETTVSRAGVIDTSLDEINLKIDSKAKEIQLGVSNGTPEKLLGLEREMETLLNERMTYLSSVVVADDQLRKYLSKEQQLSETINGWSSIVNTKKSGTVSFYFDGCEALMSKENIGSFTKKTLEELLAGKTINTAGTEQAYTSLYRIVSEEKWYVVLLSEKEVPEMFTGNSFSIVFDDYLDTKYTGTLQNQQKLANNDGYVYTIQIDGNIGPMLGDRRVSAKLYSKIQGFRIPKSILKPQNDVDYVKTAAGEYVPVLIVANDGDYVLVQTYKDQPALDVGELLNK
jgi:hypothetical protein